jgi:hypothetical protein
MATEREIAKEIMHERMMDGIELVESIAKKHNFQLSEPLLIKGIECGISLFIQKEQARRFNK